LPFTFATLVGFDRKSESKVVGSTINKNNATPTNIITNIPALFLIFCKIAIILIVKCLYLHFFQAANINIFSQIIAACFFNYS